jgi:hypothetical protein
MSLGHKAFITDATGLEIAHAKHQVTIFIRDGTLENFIMNRIAVCYERVERGCVAVISAHIGRAAHKVMSRIFHHPGCEIEVHTEWLD